MEIPMLDDLCAFAIPYTLLKLTKSPLAALIYSEYSKDLGFMMEEEKTSEDYEKYGLDPINKKLAEEFGITEKDQRKANKLLEKLEAIRIENNRIFLTPKR